MIHNQIEIERVVRMRSIAFFASRCPEHPQLPAPPTLPAATVDVEEPGQSRRGRDERGGVRWNG